MKKLWMLLALLLVPVVTVRAEDDAFDDDNSGMTVVVRNMSSKTIVVKPEKKGSSCGGQNFTSGDDFRMGPGETRILRTGRSVVAGKKKDCELNEFKIFDTKEVELLGSKNLVASDLIAQLDLDRLNGEKFNGNGYYMEILDNPFAGQQKKGTLLGKEIMLPEWFNEKRFVVRKTEWYGDDIFIDGHKQFVIAPENEEQLKRWAERAINPVEGGGLSLWVDNLSGESLQVIAEGKGSSCPDQSFVSGQQILVPGYSSQQFRPGIVAGGPEKGTMCDLKHFKVLDKDGKLIAQFRITLKSVRSDLIKGKAGLLTAKIAGLTPMAVLTLLSGGVAVVPTLFAHDAIDKEFRERELLDDYEIAQLMREGRPHDGYEYGDYKYKIKALEKQKRYPNQFRLQITKTSKGDWVYAIVRGR